MSSPIVATISFETIVKDRDATVRITDDNLIYAVDLVMVVTGKNRDDAGMVLRRLSDEVFPSVNLTERKMPGKGNANTKLISFKHAIELIMVLPGKIAKETRAQFADVIHRYMAGDASLGKEIQANAESAAPIHELARSTLADEEDLVRKRKREDLEDRKAEALVIKLEAEAIALQQANRANLIKMECELAERYSAISSDTAIDERARLLFKDNLLNLVTVGRLAIGNGQVPPAVKPISISMVAADMGFKPTTRELIRAGVEVKSRYLVKYHKDPPKHEQLCDGRVTKVNSYTEADRGLIEAVLRDQLGSEYDDDNM